LQGIKKEAGGFVFDLTGEQKAHDLHERHLDGVGVFDHGQEEGGRAAASAIDVQTDALFLVALVEVTETVAPQRGRSALRAVGFQVLTAIWILRHVWLLPPPPVIWWNHGVRGKFRINLWAAMRCGENLEAKAVASKSREKGLLFVATEEPAGGALSYRRSYSKKLRTTRG
jgi:hypothetical protein